MKPLLALTLLILSTACFSETAPPISQDELPPTIIRMPNITYCEGSPLFRLSTGRSYKGHDLRRIVLEVGSEGRIELHVAPALADDGNSYFCLLEEMLPKTLVVVGYGRSSCGGYRHSFRIQDLSTLKVDEPLTLTLDTY